MRIRYGDNSPRPRNVLPYSAVSPLLQAVLEATEEAAYNALFKATTVTGKGKTREAIPIDRVREILAKYSGAFQR
jgi:D-aminopeptidase